MYPSVIFSEKAGNNGLVVDTAYTNLRAVYYATTSIVRDGFAYTSDPSGITSPESHKKTITRLRFDFTGQGNQPALNSWIRGDMGFHSPVCRWALKTDLAIPGPDGSGEQTPIF